MRGNGFPAANPATRRWFALAALTVAALCAGCASQPAGLLVPVDPPRGAKRVDMLAATTRAPADEPGVLFTGERGAGMSFANIVVSVPPGHSPGTLAMPRTAPGNPETDFTVTSVRQLDQGGIREWLDRRRGKSRRVFVFVHGFNTRFERAVFRFAQLAHDSDADAAPILFSWPSRGRLLDYKRDNDNATYSRSDLAHLLETAAASHKVGEITILAHSLGSWVAVEAVRQIGLRRSPALAKINNLILAAPDLDIGVFRRQVEEMGPGRPRITLFVARSDRALQLSGFLTRGMTRLGAIDPSLDAYRERLTALEGVTVIDLAALRSNDRVNHDLYAQSPAVVRLIGDRLVTGQIVTDEDVETSWAAEALGGAAGMVVSAPILVLRGAAQN